MKTLKQAFLFSFLFIVLSCKGATAQNVKKDTIYVSTGSMAEITFGAAIDKTAMPGGDGSYEANTSGNAKSIMITALKKNAKAQPLVVKTGAQEFTYILLFKEGAPPVRINASTPKGGQAEQANGASAPSKGSRKAGENNKAAKNRKALKDANNLYLEGLWEEAKNKYEEISYTDQSKFVKSRLEEIKRIIAKKEETDKKYKEAMVSATNFYALKKYAEAQAAFKEALKLHPDDLDVLDRILAIDKTLRDEGSFYNYIIKADVAFKQGSFEDAVINYEEALKIKPGNTDLVKKIALARKNMVAGNFRQLKTRGDNALKARNASGARTAYNEALIIKPKDTYITRQLNKVAHLQKELDERAEKERLDSAKKVQYAGAIATAEKFYNYGDYASAIEEYKRAGRIFKDSTYPDKQINKIRQQVSGSPNRQRTFK